MNALILAAGPGTRLKPWTDTMPKCMIPVGGVPLMEHTVNLLHTYGIRRIGVNLHHLGNCVRDHFGLGKMRGVEIFYFEEESLLGTAGTLLNIRKNHSFLDEPFILMYGDTLTNLNLAMLRASHSEFGDGSHITMSVFRPRGSDYSGKVLFTYPLDRWRIGEFVEKPERGYDGFCNAGVMIIDPQFIEYIKPDHKDLSADTIPDVIARDFPVYGWKIPPYTVHMDVGTPERYSEAQKIFAGVVPYGFMFNQTKPVIHD